MQRLRCSPRPWAPYSPLGVPCARCFARPGVPPMRAAYACPLPHASSPLCTSCTVACARLRRALPSYPPRRTPRLVAPMIANPSRTRAPPRSPLSLALYFATSHYVGTAKRTLGLIYTPLAVLYLTVFALVALLGAINVYTISVLGALASLLIQVALTALAPMHQRRVWRCTRICGGLTQYHRLSAAAVQPAAPDPLLVHTSISVRCKMTSDC